jgi:hypothetical protein
MGIVSGEMLVNGCIRDRSFQRKTGYVQQQDLHLATSTVRESLIFSALIRQHKSVPREEKLAYVEEVIALLEMEDYAEAVVGVPGEGLNVEQRKRLTIAVELVAKPELLVFFDEPTSGEYRLVFFYVGLNAACRIGLADGLVYLPAHAQTREPRTGYLIDDPPAYAFIAAALPPWLIPI